MKNIDHTDFEQWLRRWTQSLPEPEAPPELLAAQRREIYRRLHEPRRNRVALRWALSFAMLFLTAAGGLTLERRHKAVPVSDEQLFSDLSAMEQSSEPKAIQPMHGLFQE